MKQYFSFEKIRLFVSGADYPIRCDCVCNQEFDGGAMVVVLTFRFRYIAMGTNCDYRSYA